MNARLRLGGPHATRRETNELRGGEVVFESPRGLLFHNRLLVDALPKRPPATGGRTRALFGMDTEGAAALAAAAIWPNADIEWVHLDSYVAAKVRRVFDDNGRTAIPAQAVADLPAGPFDVIALPFPASGEGLLMRDLIEASHDALRVGGRFVAATDKGGVALRKVIDDVFGKVTPGPPMKRGAVFFATRKRATPQRSDHSHVLTPEIRPAAGFEPKAADPIRLEIETRPGTFSHGSFDRGTRALLEWYLPEGDRTVLDLGAGCGAVGIYVARRVPEARVVLVESNVRAADCARRNAARNGVADRCEVVLVADPVASNDAGEIVVPDTSSAQDGEPASDAASAADGGFAPDAASTPNAGFAPNPAKPPVTGFDRCLANPPYFGDFRIARSFAETALAALRPGGKVAYVVRSGAAANANAEVLRDVFGRCVPYDSGDYSILTAVRRA